MNRTSAVEESVIATLLAYPKQSAGYAAEHFTSAMFDRANAIIFAAFQKTFVANGEGGAVAIARQLQASGDLERVGGMARLSALENQAGVPLLLPQAAAELRDSLALKRLTSTLDSLLSAADRNGANVASIIAEGMAQLEAIASSREAHHAPDIKTLVSQAITEIQNRANGESKGISTGLTSLDRLTGGVRPSSQWVIAGPAKGGKSSLAITFLHSLSVENKKRCVFFGLEMPSVENVERLLCHDGQVSATSCRDGELNDRMIAGLHQSAGRIATAPMHFRDDCGKLSEVVCAARQFKSIYPDLYAIFVDYAQLVGAAEDADNREREVALVSRGMRKFSMSTGIAVILLSQTNDDGKLRESRTLGMDATKIITIEFTDDAGVRKLLLVQRDGMSGIELEVAYRGEHFAFADLSRKEP